MERLQHWAVASVLRQHERERGYRTFSFQDLPKRDTDADIPGPRPPRKNLFAAAARVHRGGGRWLAYNAPARTKIGRWLRETCHTLTDGGVGFFGLLNVCGADGEAHGGLFDDLEPDYLKHARRPPGGAGRAGAPSDLAADDAPRALAETAAAP